MKTRLILGPILLLVVAGLLYLDYALISGEWEYGYLHPGFQMLALFAGIVGALEVSNMFAKRGFAPDRLSVIVSGFALVGLMIGLGYTPTAWKASSLSMLPLALPLSFVLLLGLTTLRGLWRPDVNDFLPRFGATIAAWAYVFVPVSMMMDIGWQVGYRVESGRGIFLSGLWIIIWMVMATRLGADSCAYFAGKGLGRKKMIPHVSPGKTWEGFFGGVIGAVGMTYLAAYLMPDLVASIFPRPGSEVWLIPLLGVMVGIVAPLGDLVASALKRGAGVKDSGNLLPEFGGIIDLIDGFLLVAPVVWVVVYAGRAWLYYAGIYSV